MLEWDVNLLAVIVAVVAHQVLGFLWYGPLFGRTWMAATGKTEEDIGSPNAAIAVGVVGSILSAIALGLWVSLAGEPDVGSGVTYGLVAGIGFAAATIATQGAFESKNQTVTWLYIAYQVVSFAIMGAIIGAWR